MRKLPVDIDRIADAMEDHSDSFAWYLDLETGELVMLPGIGADDPGAWPEGEVERWERLMEEEPDRFEEVPRITSHRGYRWMASFAATVEDYGLRDRLEVALDGKGAFGRFRRVLADHPEERDRWFRYHDERVDAELRAWLESLGIEPAGE